MSLEAPGMVIHGPAYAPNYSWIADKDSLVSVIVELDHGAVDADLPATFPAGTLQSGLVLGKITSGGKYQQYDDANSPAGVGVAKGILFHAVTLRDPYNATLPSGQVVLAAMVVAGAVDSNFLFGIDANGIADLQAQGMVFVDQF